MRLHAAVPAADIIVEGAAQARPAPGVLEAIAAADVVLFPPSNPVVSIGAILAVPAIADAVRAKTVVGVSPIIGGAPVRGMADACLAAIGVPATAQAVAAHYGPGPAERVAGGRAGQGRGGRAGTGRDHGPRAAAVHDQPRRHRHHRPGRPRPGPGAARMTGDELGGPAAGRSLSVTGVPGLPEIGAGDDLAGLIADAAPDLADGDIVVITSKIVSKAEGRRHPGRPGQGDRRGDGPGGGAARPGPHRGDPPWPGARRGRGGRLQHRPGHGGAAARGPGRLGPPDPPRAARPAGRHRGAW